MSLPKPPPEPPRITTLEGLAPKFRMAIETLLVRMQDAGFAVKVFESLRTNERQQWLYGFGRTWDDGRHRVTNVPNAWRGWHVYGCAVDIVEDDATPWQAPTSFWQTLGRLAEEVGCKWGGRWKRLDLPHVQWGRCRQSPSPKAYELYKMGGREAVWAVVRAA